MKTGQKRRSTLSRDTFNKMKFKEGFDAKYEEYRTAIKAINKVRAAEIVDHEEGHVLPNNLGRVIILKVKPKIKKLYSMTRPGNRIFNLHSFQYIYKVHHKERLLLRYPELFKFRPHRANIKMPLYDNIMSGDKEYYKLSDYFE